MGYSSGASIQLQVISNQIRKQAGAALERGAAFLLGGERKRRSGGGIE